jgi:FolB domain-containing protein
MNDIITIRDLVISTYIGVPDEERELPQSLHVNLKMHVPSVQSAAQRDDVSLTVNYYDVAQSIKKLALEKPRRLIETLAEEIAGNVLKNFAVAQVEVEIKKYILPDTEYVSICITRSANSKDKV